MASSLLTQGESRPRMSSETWRTIQAGNFCKPANLRLKLRLRLRFSFNASTLRSFNPNSTSTLTLPTYTYRPPNTYMYTISQAWISHAATCKKTCLKCQGWLVDDPRSVVIALEQSISDPWRAVPTPNQWGRH